MENLHLDVTRVNLSQYINDTLTLDELENQEGKPMACGEESRDLKSWPK